MERKIKVFSISELKGLFSFQFIHKLVNVYILYDYYLVHKFKDTHLNAIDLSLHSVISHVLNINIHIKEKD